MLISRTIYRYLPVVLLGFVLGSLIGFSYYQLSWTLLQDSKIKEKATILRLTDAFVTVYSGVRSSALKKDAPVPATYRAHAIKSFNKNAPKGDAIRVRMVGFPGRAIKTEPLDSKMAENIRAFLNVAKPKPTYSVIKNPTGTVLRTLYPSIAKKKSCVECHNGLQAAGPRWAINDVMGAFAVDAPVSVALAKLRRESSIVGLIIFLFTSIVGVYLQSDIIRRRLNELGLTKAKNYAENALQRAEVAERTKSEFLANMSHEIRTPMNGVMGMADLLSSTNLDEKQQKFTNVIVNSSSSLLKIINDILDFSKMDAYQITLESKPFDLAKTIDDVAALMSKTAQEKGLELVVRIQPGLPEMFEGDAGRIRQVVINLVGNAIKFTNSGHVLIDVSASAQTDPDDEKTNVTVTVKDTGDGIAKDKLEIIFEQFRQVDGSSTRQHDGTGLGLAISKRLVEIMGGEIGVESNAGNGSTFWIKIPLKADNIRRTPSANPMELSGKNILIVDDNEVNRSILREQLSAWNVRTQSAVSGAEGLAQLRTAQAVDHPIDLVILDYHMPTMNGVDVVEVIRAEEPIKDTPILLLTSVDHSTELENIAVEARLAKPVPNNVMLDTVAAILRKAPVRTSGPAEELEAKENTEKSGKLTVTPIDRSKSTLPLVVNQHKTEPLGSKKPERIPILIAEDNEINLMLLTEILDKAKLNYVCAQDGAQVIALAKQTLPRVILMDVSMPGINGFDATRTIRQIEQENGIPRTAIIGQTGHALAGDKQKCLDAGMDDYLAKPICATDLLTCIEHWLYAQSSQNEKFRARQ